MTNALPIGYGIDSIAASDIWAVGPGPSIFHFDGKIWSVVPPGVTTAELWAVEASSADDLWAGGDVLGSSAAVLVEHAPSATSGAVVGHTNVSGAVVSWFGPETGSVGTDQVGIYAAGGLTAGGVHVRRIGCGRTPTGNGPGDGAGRRDHPAGSEPDLLRSPYSSSAGAGC